jgi:hypothetical protein
MSARALFNSALALFALATAGCGGGSDATGPSSPGGSDPGGSNPAPTPSANTGTLEVSNPTDVTVYYLKVRACGATDFGADLLLDPNDGVGGLLQTGETGHWQLTPGCYDVRLSPSNALFYVWAKQIHANVQIQAGQTASIAATTWSPYDPAAQ